jgi:hypothetical protein
MSRKRSGDDDLESEEEEEEEEEEEAPVARKIAKMGKFRAKKMRTEEVEGDGD